MNSHEKKLLPWSVVTVVWKARPSLTSHTSKQYQALGMCLLQTHPCSNCYLDHWGTLTFAESPWSTSLLCCISFPRPGTGFESLWDAHSRCDTMSVPRSSSSPTSAFFLYSPQYSVEVGFFLVPTLLSHFLLLAAGENKCQGKSNLGVSVATTASHYFSLSSIQYYCWLRSAIKTAQDEQSNNAFHIHRG